MNKLRSIIAAALVAASVTGINAATPVVMELWSDGAPTSNGISADREENSNPDWITYV